MTTRTLRISDTLTLPLDAATQTFGILAKRGAGKSNAAVVMAYLSTLRRNGLVDIDGSDITASAALFLGGNA